MKRGVIRIVLGIVMIFSQIISFAGQDSIDFLVYESIWLNIGFVIGYFIVGIIGMVLLIFGARTYKKEICSQLVLHNNSKKKHFILKWVSFSFSALLFICYLLAMIFSEVSYGVLGILIVLSVLSYMLYSLFYMYKKPSTLFSTTLVFLGCSSLFSGANNYKNLILYFYSNNLYLFSIFNYCVPQIITGLLYISIAILIYREKFSVKAVKVLGWIVFAFEMYTRVISRLLEMFVLDVLIGISVEDILLTIFVVFLFVFTSVFEINTLRIKSKNTDNVAPTESRTNDIKNLTVSNTFPKEQILFCRMCGAKLQNDSKFCSGCGNKLVE